MTASSDTELYYDPFDTEIDKDPHPVWRRLRDQAPLYYNEKYDFFALSRFDDVDKALMVRLLRSSRPMSSFLLGSSSWRIHRSMTSIGACFPGCSRRRK
jgi:hypothetical protein